MRDNFKQNKRRIEEAKKKKKLEKLNRKLNQNAAATEPAPDAHGDPSAIPGTP